jgi:hypothetical protein
MTLALLLFGLLQAPGATPEQNEVRKTLERLETEWNVAHVRGDAAALDRIFSDDGEDDQLVPIDNSSKLAIKLLRTAR